MEELAELLSTITVKRRSLVDQDSIRTEYAETTFTIQGIAQAYNITRGGSDVETRQTLNAGNYGIGEVLLVTETDLNLSKDGTADIIILEDGEYKITSKKRYDKLIPHFEYTCLRIV